MAKEGTQQTVKGCKELSLSSIEEERVETMAGDSQAGLLEKEEMKTPKEEEDRHPEQEAAVRRSQAFFLLQHSRIQGRG